MVNLVVNSCVNLVDDAHKMELTIKYNATKRVDNDSYSPFFVSFAGKNPHNTQVRVIKKKHLRYIGV